MGDFSLKYVRMSAFYWQRSVIKTEYVDNKRSVFAPVSLESTIFLFLVTRMDFFCRVSAGKLSTVRTSTAVSGDK